MPSAVRDETQRDESTHDGASLKGSDSISAHSLGVRPLGNQYLVSGPNSRANIGTWRFLPDEMLMLVLETFDQSCLVNLGQTCKFLFAFCHADELWKAICLGLVPEPSRPVCWKGSWRSTVLGVSEQRLARVDCSTVFSDVLHRPFACSEINLAQYTSNIPKANQIRRFDNLAYDEFAENWTQEPFILTECIQNWPVTSEWTIDGLLRDYGETVFRAEAVDWPFSAYHEYMTKNRDESPLYLFDRKFVEKMGITVGNDAGASYWRPECFGPDFFEILGKERPAHRWLIVGPARSGSTFHKDPNGTSAWNAVIEGKKYWIMFPPNAQVPGVYVSRDSSEVTSPLSIAEWLLAFHEEARQLPECVEGVCNSGEILHVPSGWWHLVVNLEQGIALTQNFVPQSPSLHHLSEVLSFLRDKADQVSGFRRDIESPFALFTERLEESYPDALRKALEQADKKNDKKRKWDDAVAAKDNEQGSGGFSFGFSFDEEEDEIP